MKITRKSVALQICILTCFSFVLPAQEGDKIPDQSVENPVVENKITGELSFFIDNRLIFALSAPDVGFGFGSTANFQYVFPFNMSIGLEAGYYSARTEIYNGENSENLGAVGGYSLVPVYASVSYNIPIVKNLFYITPVLKAGGAYNRVKINGWLGGDSFAFLFEGGLRFKIYVREEVLIHVGVLYTGLVEKSGVFSILSVGMGLGF